MTMKVKILIYSHSCPRCPQCARRSHLLPGRIQSKHIPWGERNKVRTLRRDVVPCRVANEPMWFSQCEMMSSKHNGVTGGGREPLGQVHVLKVSHHGSILVAWSRAMHVLKRRLRFLPNLKLFAILRTVRNRSVQEFRFDYFIPRTGS